MSSSDEDKMPLYPKGKKFYSDKYIKGTASSRNRRWRLYMTVLLIIIAICFVILLIGVIVGVLVHHVFGGNDSTEPWLSKRLPSDAIPDNYTITLDVNLESLLVEGQEDIMVTMKSDSHWILLQILDMNVTEVSAIDTISSAPIEVSHSPYTENDYLIIENINGVFSKDNTYKLTLKFSYFLYSGGLAGFYNSTFKDENGNEVILATTQFEATDARRAFPCFDEPQLKSVFIITIVHPNDKIALSNMPVQSMQSDGNGRTETSFQPSKRMSTYLVAFIVCNFQSKSAITKNGVNVSVWSRPSLVEDTAYPLDMAVRILEYYEEFFNISYPLPKMDLVAIPDFSSGAMENWGLITYRETALLFNASIGSASDQQWVTEVIAHELAHQWFGNLVTMEWWQDLWLNEGFASYVEYLGTNIAQPQWGFLNFFVTGDLHVALEADSYNETHPIIQPAETLSEINALFDSISYSKGASLIRMIAGFMGMEAFQKGLTEYINAHLYQNAKSSDLWSALQGNTDPSEYNLTAVMDTWTIQAGYPILNVTTQDCTSIAVTQERFVIIPTDTFAESEFNYIWRIPFTYITDTQTTSETHWINDPSKTINGGSECKWIKANKGQLGFYRVMYDENMWGVLIVELQANPTTFEIEDRANLLDDSVALSLAGRLTSMQALNLTSYLKLETEYIPWRAGLLALSQIHTKLILTKAEGKFSQFLLCLLSNETQNALQDWNSNNLTDHLVNLKMNLILKYALLYGDSSVGKRAYDEFRDFMANNNTQLNPNLKSIIYTAGIKMGGVEEWNYLWELYLSSNNPTEQAACLSALAYAEKPWLIQLYLEKSLYEVRSQDALTVLRRLGVNVHAWPYLWNFFKENYDLLFSRHGAAKSFGRAITAIISHFSTQSQLDDVISFFSGRDVGAGETSVNSAIEQIKSNIQWIDVNVDKLDGWLGDWVDNNC